MRMNSARSGWPCSSSQSAKTRQDVSSSSSCSARRNPTSGVIVGPPTVFRDCATRQRYSTHAQDDPLSEDAVPARLVPGDLLGWRHAAEIRRAILRLGLCRGSTTLTGTGCVCLLLRLRRDRRLAGAVWRGGRADRHAVAAVVHHVCLQLHVLFERAVRADIQFLQDAVISADRLLGTDLAVGDESQEVDECELILGVVDLAAEQGDASAVLFRLAEQLEGIVGRAGRSTEDADDEVRVVADQ